MSQEVQVYFFGLRWSCQDHWEPEHFLRAQPHVNEVLSKVFDRFVYQIEAGEDTNRLHYQIFAHKKDKDRPKHLAVVLHRSLPGVDVQACSTAGKEALENYCMKPERVAGPWSDANRYTGNDLPSLLWPWQKFIVDEISQEPDSRTVNWVYDASGCSGKSTLAKYVCFHKIGRAYPWGRTQDLLYLLTRVPPSKVYLFDLSRTKQKEVCSDDLYAALEQIKNGFVTSTKFTCSQSMFAPPHVWVFSNQLPDETRMSSDRWRVFTLRNRVLEPYHPFALEKKDDV